MPINETVAIAEMANRHPAAELLLAHAALLAADAIPLFLFADAREGFSEPLATALASDGLEAAVTALHGVRLIERGLAADTRDPSLTTDCLLVLGRVREAVIARRDAAALEAMRQAWLHVISAVYPEDGYANPDAWPRCALLTPHAVAICETARDDRTIEATRAELLDRAASYLHGSGNLGAAWPLYERALEIRETVLGPDDLDTSGSLNNLGLVLAALERWDDAWEPLERALEIRERVLGVHHATANSLSNLAGVVWALGDRTRAVSLMKRAVDIDAQVCALGDPALIANLNNLALLLIELGEPAQARPHVERALAISERAHGHDHPNTNAIRANRDRLAGKTERARWWPWKRRRQPPQ